MDPGLGQKCVPSLKNTTNWATDFFGAFQTKERPKGCWVRVGKEAWILGAWLTLESSSLFFFAELPHCVNHSVRIDLFFGPCVGFCLKYFLGASVTLHS